MIDWLTGIFPCTHKPLPAGSVVSVDADGAIEWETVKRLTVRGSHEATMKVRSIGSNGEGKATHLYIDGNPSKFLQGHSVVGSDDIQGLMLTVYARILSLLNIPHDLASYKTVMAGQYKISRVDINYMYSLSTLENVRSWLYAAEFKAKTRHGRACGKGGTVYLGKNSRRWSLKFYSKYDEHVSGKKGHQIAEEVQIKDGQTLLLGGLIDSSFSNAERSVPVISKIPLIGWIFSSKADSNEQRIMYILLTAHIIRPL
ncbi:hypothetical protein C2703_003333 [Escherichia coli]|nr:hypothetical protein [Escherichia coli]